MPKHLKVVFGMLLLGVVIRFTELTQHLLQGYRNFEVLQSACLLILTMGVIKGFADQCLMAWKVARVAVAILLVLSLFGMGVLIFMATRVEGLGLLLLASALGCLLNVYVLWVLCSRPVRDYFHPCPEIF
jgi:hypothetical protein